MFRGWNKPRGDIVGGVWTQEDKDILARMYCVERHPTIIIAIYLKRTKEAIDNQVTLMRLRKNTRMQYNTIRRYRERKKRRGKARDSLGG